MNVVVLHPWRAIYWEPVSGTGERVTVGAVYRYGDTWAARRILRDDVLTCLYGKAANGARRLIDHGLSLFLAAANAAQSLENLSVPLGGLYPGPARATEALTESELLRIVALQYSSVANLDKLDDLDEFDQPINEEAARRFATDVREHVLAERADLSKYFHRTAPLVMSGEPVRFGYASTRLIAHFNILNPMRHGASLRDARARLFELNRGRDLAQLSRAALITGVPRDDDPLLGDRQRARLREMREELTHEATAVDVAFAPVHAASEGARTLLQLEAA
ncbi:MAG: hypothetical protein BGP23_13250 [Lysobacterales bacterium 66-474]|nr:MAG: hypothetical protein ABT18_05095 [Rhodanobacter sp. SCN 66-43]OJY87083.1 MAG: hypothetical protein BGP23_13250 [Xanthomonadales bacterium 66-474]